MLLHPLSMMKAATAGGPWSPSLVDNQGSAFITAVDDPGDSAFFSMAVMFDFTSVDGTGTNFLDWGRHSIDRSAGTFNLEFQSTGAAVVASGNTGTVLSAGTLHQLVVLLKTSGTKYFKVYIDGSIVINLGDGSVTAATMDHSRTNKTFFVPDLQRLGAFWLDADTDPDTFDISDFWSGGQAIDYTGLGTPNYVVNGGASVWNAGTNTGNLSDFTVTGTFVDV